MVLNKSKLIPFSNTNSQVNFVKHNLPGLYFLFNKDYKLIYIGESIYPLCRILDHCYKPSRGVGPVFAFMRIMQVTDSDFRIRQHYEKRWIKKFNSPLNYNGDTAPYELSYKEIKGFIAVYEGFFKDMPWFTYINDYVLKKQQNYIDYRREQRHKKERAKLYD
jgi:hypothetical protein|tara:strand:+ start:475 stop:963 length:489 start_codon:yes stop_codon:yes gene_type:complete